MIYLNTHLKYINWNNDLGWNVRNISQLNSYVSGV